MDDFFRQLCKPFFDFTFPDDDDAPSCGFQIGVFLLVTGDIAFEFLGPKFDVGFGHCCDFAAFVAMPEASVDENDGMPFWKDDVGMTRQFRGMQSVSEAQRMEVVAHDNLRLRVFRADFAHGGAALFWREGVHVLHNATRCMRRMENIARFYNVGMVAQSFYCRST